MDQEQAELVLVQRAAAGDNLEVGHSPAAQTLVVHMAHTLVVAGQDIHTLVAVDNQADLAVVDNHNNLAAVCRKAMADSPASVDNHNLAAGRKAVDSRNPVDTPAARTAAVAADSPAGRNRASEGSRRVGAAACKGWAWADRKQQEQHMPWPWGTRLALPGRRWDCICDQK